MIRRVDRRPMRPLAAALLLGAGLSAAGAARAQGLGPSAGFAPLPSLAWPGAAQDAPSRWTGSYATLSTGYAAVSSGRFGSFAGPTLGLEAGRMWQAGPILYGISGGLDYLAGLEGGLTPGFGRLTYTRDLAGALGGDVEVGINRQDWATYGDDPFAVTRTVVIAVLVLLLGALGLVNIALVTVKQRVREIGIRRSFGATASRVFFAVMMESVVATVVAGAVGVIVSILVVQSPAVRDLVGQGMVSDFPPFPVDAAVTGLVAATGVGALAGLLPALVAVRVKVIDAIRY